MLNLVALVVLMLQQDEPQKKKEAILEKVKANLEETRKKVLERAAAIIDEEFNKKPAEAVAPNAKVEALEKRLREIRSEMEKVRGELVEARVMAADEKLYNECRKSELELADAQEMFTEALNQLNAKEFEESVNKFKKVFYSLLGNEDAGRLPCTSAYNIACGYSLWGKKELALDWLEISAARGFLDAEGKLEHMEGDTDLDNIRAEPRYKDLVRKAKSK